MAGGSRFTISPRPSSTIPGCPTNKCARSLPTSGPRRTAGKCAKSAFKTPTGSTPPIGERPLIVGATSCGATSGSSPGECSAGPPRFTRDQPQQALVRLERGKHDGLRAVGKRRLKRRAARPLGRRVSGSWRWVVAPGKWTFGLSPEPQLDDGDAAGLESSSPSSLASCPPGMSANDPRGPRRKTLSSGRWHG